MAKIISALLAIALSLTACASPGFRSDCLARKKKADRVVAIADAELSAGLTMDQVRATLGQEPNEIITEKGLPGLETWKYYVVTTCKASLGITAPTTELIFFQGRLSKWRSYTE
jgi:hypothetical protein